MIDVVVINNSDGIEKTLLSIYIQTIKNKVKVHIVSNKKSDVIDKFKDRLDIEEIITEDTSLGKMRNIALKKCKNMYITFMKSSDVFYDVFALNNIYKLIDDLDVIFGQVVNNKVAYSNNFIEGNLYRRQFLIKNKIKFIDSNSGDNGFNKLLLMFNPKFRFSDDLIYYMENYEDDWIVFSREVIDDTISSLKIAVENNCNFKIIAQCLYDTLIYFAYLYYAMSNKDDIKLISSHLNKCYKWYLKYVDYLDDNIRKFVSNYYGNDVNFDNSLLLEMIDKIV